LEDAIDSGAKPLAILLESKSFDSEPVEAVLADDPFVIDKPGLYIAAADLGEDGHFLIRIEEIEDEDGEISFQGHADINLSREESSSINTPPGLRDIRCRELE